MDLQKFIVELFERVKALIDPVQKRMDAIETAQADTVEALKTAHADEIRQLKADFAEQIKQVRDQIPHPVDSAAIVDTVKVAMSAQLADMMPPPEPVKNGEPGRDALDIEILPAVDFDKSYPRGTYALHKGGVIRAHQATVGEKGWETVWNGIDHIDVAKSGHREVVITLSMTNGQTQEHRVPVPTMVLRGHYREDETYTEGDAVRSGNSLWVATKDTSAKPGAGPEDETGWMLVAKRGSPGKSYTRQEIAALVDEAIAAREVSA